MGFEVDTVEVARLAVELGDIVRLLERFEQARSALDALSAATGSVRVHRASSRVTDGWVRVVGSVMADIQTLSWLLAAGADTYTATDWNAVG